MKKGESSKEFISFLAGGVIVLIVALILSTGGRIATTTREEIVTPIGPELFDTAYDGVYTDEQLGISVPYPRAWELRTIPDPYGGDEKTISFYSPDFKSETTHVVLGIRATIYASNRADHTDDPYQLPGSASKITIGGEEALSWFVSNGLGVEPGNDRMEAIFYRGDRRFLFICDYSMEQRNIAVEICSGMLQGWDFFTT